VRDLLAGELVDLEHHEQRALLDGQVVEQLLEHSPPLAHHDVVFGALEVDGGELFELLQVLLAQDPTTPMLGRRDPEADAIEPARHLRVATEGRQLPVNDDEHLSFLSFALLAPSAHAFCRSTTATQGTLDADGCPAEGQPLYWKNECIGMHLDEAASRYVGLDAARSLLVQAYSDWTAAGGLCVPSIQFVQLAPTANAKVEYTPNGTNENDVLFHDDSWPYTGAQTTLELVTTSFQKDTGGLLDADVELNSSRFPGFLAAVDGGASDPANVPVLRRLFMHAVGHVLGFAHSQDPNSIMYSQRRAGDMTPPVLTADDAAGICTA